jgi:single-stranded-DNA-specific exonuclease
MDKKWKIKTSTVIFSEEIKKEYHPLILELLAKRGIKTEKEIKQYFQADYDIDLSDPLKVVGMKKAVERIIKAHERKEKIAIYGDYDADGVSSSAVLYEVLTSLNFSKETLCYIPDRQSEGYGLNKPALDYLKKKGVTLIITVDCGITNVSEVEIAKKMGMEVIITDHHHIPVKLPKAYTVINPHLANSGFGFTNLAGVGVAFKLAQALLSIMDNSQKEQLKWLLDLVAIGTIADCVPLLGENRVLAKYGLLVLSKTKRAGLLEMFKVGRINISEDNIPNAHKVAFQISPRINAAGRMDHANTAYKLLIEKNVAQARILALEIEDKNKERQKITSEIFQEVKIIVSKSFSEKKFIFAENSHWPVGLLGLVAGKITEEFKKPALIMQRQEKELVGSLRSIPEVNIIEKLEKCQDLLIKFGGHPQAAGISIRPENLVKFSQKMTQLIEKELAKKEINFNISVDSEIKTDDINWELITQLKKMEPFGVGNEEPILVTRNLVIKEINRIGNDKKHLKLWLKPKNSPKILEAIGFSLASKFPKLKKSDKIDIVFNLQENEWNGQKKIQLNIIDIKLKTKIG